MIRIFVALLAFGPAQNTVADALVRLADPRPSHAQSGRAVAIQPLPSLFSADDYPREAIRKGEQGASLVRLTIDVEGRASNCQVVQSSGSATLDEATCRILHERGRFTPARDAKGVPTADQFATRIRWELPPAPVAPFENAKFRYIFTLDDARGIAGCRLEKSRALSNGLEDQCSIMRQTAAAIIGALPESIPLAGRDFIFETQFIVGRGDLGGEIGASPGEMLIFRARLTLRIGADGSVTSCGPELDGLLRGASLSDCGPATRDRYEPLGDAVANRSDRALTRVVAAYLAPIKAQ